MLNRKWTALDIFRAILAVIILGLIDYTVCTVNLISNTVFIVSFRAYNIITTNTITIININVCHIAYIITININIIQFLLIVVSTNIIINLTIHIIIVTIIIINTGSTLRCWIAHFARLRDDK